MIKAFLGTFDKESEKNFASFLIIEMVKRLKSDDLREYDRILAFVRKAVASSGNSIGAESEENIALTVFEKIN